MIRVLLDHGRELISSQIRAPWSAGVGIGWLRRQTIFMLGVDAESVNLMQ
jgi:hypothetical protein